MDNYICKAKRTDNGEWITGYFIGSAFGQAYLAVQENEIARWRTYPVDLITVSRSTGLRDKHGELIFENDYVRTEFGRICEVSWFTSPTHCGWDLVPVLNLDAPPPNKNTIWTSENLEVLSNRFLEFF